MKKIYLFLLLLFSSLFLAACQKSDIVFWHTMGKENLTKIMKLYEQWSKQTGIKVKFDQKGGYPELKEAVSKSLPAGTGPNVSFCYNDHVAAYNSGNVKEVVDLQEFIDRDKNFKDELEKDFIEGYRDEGKAYPQKGNLKGFFNLPFAKSTEVLYYNKDVIEQEGIALERLETWEGIIEVAKELKAKPKYKNKKILGYDSEANFYITLAQQYGLPYTTTDEIIFADKTKNKDAIKLLKQFRELAQEEIFITAKTSGDKYTSNLFKKQDLIFSIGSSGGAKYNIPADSQKNSNVEFKVGVTRIPQSKLGLIKSKYEEYDRFIKELDKKLSEPNITTEDKTKYEQLRIEYQAKLALIKPEYEANKDIIDKFRVSSIQQGPNLCMFDKGVEKNQKAWLFIKFMTSTEVMAEYSIASGYSPARRSSYQYEGLKTLISEGGKVDPKDYKTQFTRIVADNLHISEISQKYFFSSPAFAIRKKGSSTKARDQISRVIPEILTTKDIKPSKDVDEFIQAKLEDAYNEAVK